VTLPRCTSDGKADPREAEWPYGYLALQANLDEAVREETTPSVGITGGIVGRPTSPSRQRTKRPLEDQMPSPEAYCVKCKTKREMKDATHITMKNGRPATEGKCPVCGTKMFKIGAA
jgi:hypothetical protein